MTEQEWLACTDVSKMVSQHPLRSEPRVSERTLRLLTIAALLPSRDFLTGERSRKAIEILERRAEGMATTEELATAAAEAQAAADEVEGKDQVAAQAVAMALSYGGPALPALGWLWDGPDAAIDKARSNYFAVPTLAAQALAVARLGRGKGYERFHAIVKADLARQANVLRDVLGNPFRPVSGNPGWFTATVKNLATGIYEEHAFDRMPVLADALEDAGCDDHDMLAHCQTPGLHVRGCWV